MSWQTLLTIIGIIAIIFALYAIFFSGNRQTQAIGYFVLGIVFIWWGATNLMVAYQLYNTPQLL